MSLTPVADYPSRRQDNDWVDLMRPAADLAVQIADTEFVPDTLRNRPGAIAAAILFGAEIGLGPMQSLAKIDIVKGRPHPKAEIGRALALAAGHELWIDEQTNTRCTVKGRRRNAAHLYTLTWTIDDARKAGIAGGVNWAKYPRQMLFARASAELVRQMCPEVTGGIVMFAEEAIDAEPAPPTNKESVGPTLTTTTETPPPTPTQKRQRAPVRRQKQPAETTNETTEPKPETTEPEPHPAEEPDTQPTEAQTKMAMALFADLGITERDDRLAATTAFVDRPIDSWNNLNRNEASTVIDALGKVKAGGISFHIADDGHWTTIASPTADELLDADDE